MGCGSWETVAGRRDVEDESWEMGYESWETGAGS